jgi:four helix bundle protein
MQNYKELKVWEKAHLFTLHVYEVTRLFPREETYGLVSQLRRSAVSIPANIAEGCGKKGKAELAHFLNIALGSANESEYYVILSKDLSYISEEAHVKLVSSINEIKAMLIALTIKVRE